MDNKDDDLLNEFNRLLDEEHESTSRVVYLMKEIKTQKQLAMNSPRENDQVALIVFYETILNYLQKKAG